MDAFKHLCLSQQWRVFSKEDVLVFTLSEAEASQLRQKTFCWRGILQPPLPWLRCGALTSDCFIISNLTQNRTSAQRGNACFCSQRGSPNAAFTIGFFSLGLSIFLMSRFPWKFQFCSLDSLLWLKESSLRFCAPLLDFCPWKTAAWG